MPVTDETILKLNLLMSKKLLIKSLEEQVEDLRKGRSPKNFRIHDFEGNWYSILDEKYNKIIDDINRKKLAKFNYKDFDYEKYIECFKYPKEGTAKDSVMYDPTVYKIFNDEKYKNSIPYVIKEIYGSFRKDKKEYVKKGEDEKRAEHYISEFSKALGLKKDRVKYDLELICPDLFDKNNGKLYSYSALIISKYLDKDALENLVLTCKKFKETPEKLRFNPIPLTDKKTRDLFPNLETQYIYSEKDIVFADGKIGQYHIENGVCVFNCKGADALESIKLYKMEKITGAMFADLKKIKKIILPDSVKKIGDLAFAGCASLKEITLPNSVKKIDCDAFVNCENLKEIIIPNSMREIGGMAFRLCTGLEKITIPNSVKEIGEDAFDECTSLQTVYMKGGELDEKLKQEIIEQCGHRVDFVRK